MTSHPAVIHVIGNHHAMAQGDGQLEWGRVARAALCPPTWTPQVVFRWSMINNRSAFGNPHTTNRVVSGPHRTKWPERIPCNDEASTTTSQSGLGPTLFPPVSSDSPTQHCNHPWRRVSFRTFIYYTLDATFDFQQNYIFLLLNLFSGILAFLCCKSKSWCVCFIVSIIIPLKNDINHNRHILIFLFKIFKILMIN